MRTELEWSSPTDTIERMVVVHRCHCPYYFCSHGCMLMRLDFGSFGSHTDDMAGRAGTNSNARNADVTHDEVKTPNFASTKSKKASQNQKAKQRGRRSKANPNHHCIDVVVVAAAAVKARASSSYR